MKRRSFIGRSVLASLFAGTAWSFSPDKIPPHNWEGHDFGSPPTITDRLNQGPFFNYGSDVNALGADGALLLRKNL